LVDGYILFGYFPIDYLGFQKTKEGFAKKKMQSLLSVLKKEISL